MNGFEFLFALMLVGGITFHVTMWLSFGHQSKQEKSKGKTI